MQRIHKASSGSISCRDSAEPLLELILQSFKRLTSLSLKARGAGSGAISRELENLPDLEELTLHKCNGATNETLYNLQGLSNLKKLDLSWNEEKASSQNTSAQQLTLLLFTSISAKLNTLTLRKICNELAACRNCIVKQATVRTKQ